MVALGFYKYQRLKKEENNQDEDEKESKRYPIKDFLVVIIPSWTESSRSAFQRLETDRRENKEFIPENLENNLKMCIQISSKSLRFK